MAAKSKKIRPNKDLGEIQTADHVALVGECQRVVNFIKAARSVGSPAAIEASSTVGSLTVKLRVEF